MRARPTTSVTAPPSGADVATGGSRCEGVPAQELATIVPATKPRTLQLEGANNFPPHRRRVRTSVLLSLAVRRSEVAVPGIVDRITREVTVHKKLARMLVLGVALGIWSCGSDDTSPKGSDGVAGSDGLATGTGGSVSGIGGSASGTGGSMSGIGGSVTGIGGSVSGIGGSVSGIGGSGVGGYPGSGGAGVGGAGLGGESSATGGSGLGGDSSATGGSGVGGETSATGGAGLGGDTSATGGSGVGGETIATGGADPGSGGTVLTGGSAGSGGSETGGSAGAAGEAPTGGTAGTGGSTVSGCEVFPDLPGAERSSLYSVTVNGSPLFVEKMSKFSPQMQVHYAHCAMTDSSDMDIEVAVSGGFNSYTLSPRSRQLAISQNGDTISFSSGPNYLILQVDSNELLFILLDPPEANPPRLGDANVKNLADYAVDNTGATLVTSQIQSAIDAASGAAQNILYVPPGRYTVGELWLRSDMTMYLAGGALLYGSGSTGDFNTGRGGINIEGCSHGMIRMYQISNTQLLGRGVIDGNGLAIRAQNDTKVNLLKIEESSDILVDGILVRDSSFWNTLIYRSDGVTIQDYKMINCRPNQDWNNTDGVDFDESTNGVLYNAFLYTGDDSMATKNEEPAGTVNTSNIVHERVVAYSNSVGCKIGTKSMGQSMDGVVFRDIDVVAAGRALTMEGYDTAAITNTTFEDIRVESAGIFIKLALDEPPDWRNAANQSVYQDTYFTNVSSDQNRTIILHGRSGTSGTIDGVHFTNLTIQGNPVTSQTDGDASWNIANGVTNITFQ